jgi:hypothetical protein
MRLEEVGKENLKRGHKELQSIALESVSIWYYSPIPPSSPRPRILGGVPLPTSPSSLIKLSDNLAMEKQINIIASNKKYLPGFDPGR